MSVLNHDGAVVPPRDVHDDLRRANALMIEALRLLDTHRNAAAPHLDLALARLGLRSEAEAYDVAERSFT